MTPLPSLLLIIIIIVILWCDALSSTHHSAVCASVISPYSMVRLRRSNILLADGSDVYSLTHSYPVNVNGCFPFDFLGPGFLEGSVSGYMSKCSYEGGKYLGSLVSFTTSDCTGTSLWEMPIAGTPMSYGNTQVVLSFTCFGGPIVSTPITPASSTPTTTSPPPPPPPTTTTTTTTTTSSPPKTVAQCKADYQSYSSTANPPQPCGPYDCLEDIFKCNADSFYRNRYLSNYGKKFCDIAHNEMNAKLTSPRSLAWSVGTRKCLQLKLLDNVQLTWSCGQITNFAYNSHVPCYTSAQNPSGQSICLLPPADQVKIVWYMKGGLVSSCSAVKQAIDVFKECKTQVLKYISVKIEAKTGLFIPVPFMDSAINKLYNMFAPQKIKMIGSIISKVSEGVSSCGTVEELLADISSNNVAAAYQRVASSTETTSVSHPLPTLDGSFTLTLAVAPDENSTTIDEDIAFLKNDLFNESASNLTTIISNALLEQSNGSFKVVDVSETRSSEFLDAGNNAQGTEDGNVGLGVIIGASGGGFAFISAAAFLLIRYFHNRSKKQDDVSSSASESSEPMDEVPPKFTTPGAEGQ